tara:strand:- start:94 stop:243 length:150 start_codon:yes stop_codon:yes gene_type:complete
MQVSIELNHYTYFGQKISQLRTLLNQAIFKMQQLTYQALLMMSQNTAST